MSKKQGIKETDWSITICTFIANLLCNIAIYGENKMGTAVIVCGQNKNLFCGVQHRRAIMICGIIAVVQ